ncbi:MAG TPA: ECF transporter S component [Ktedonobacteraceae bacterium]|jgi:energy-coupling factor transport system substrate-specific component
MQAPSTQQKGLAAWNTRDLLVAVVIPVVLGVILTPVLLYTHALMMVIPPFVSGLSTGLWVIAGIMVPYIIRRPGSAFLGALLVGLIEGPFSPFGWIILLLQVAVGLFCEIPFALTRYRSYTLLFLCSAGAVGNLGPVVINYVLYHYASLNPAVQITHIAAYLLGGVLGGLVAKLLADTLAKTGVLRSYALGRKHTVEV